MIETFEKFAKNNTFAGLGIIARDGKTQVTNFGKPVKNLTFEAFDISAEDFFNEQKAFREHQCASKPSIQEIRRLFTEITEDMEILSDCKNQGETNSIEYKKLEKANEENVKVFMSILQRGLYKGKYHLENESKTIKEDLPEIRSHLKEQVKAITTEKAKAAEAASKKAAEAKRERDKAKAEREKQAFERAQADERAYGGGWA